MSTIRTKAAKVHVKFVPVAAPPDTISHHLAIIQQMPCAKVLIASIFIGKYENSCIDPSPPPNPTDITPVVIVVHAPPNLPPPNYFYQSTTKGYTYILTYGATYIPFSWNASDTSGSLQTESISPSSQNINTSKLYIFISPPNLQNNAYRCLYMNSLVVRQHYLRYFRRGPVKQYRFCERYSLHTGSAVPRYCFVW